MTSWISVRD